MMNRSMWRFATPLLVCLIVLFTHLVTLNAQDLAAGSIHGTVADLRGQVIQGATIAVTNGTDLKRTGVSNDKGEFAITGLASGSYTVSISASGFATQEHPGVIVSTGASSKLSVSLTVASVSE